MPQDEGLFGKTFDQQLDIAGEDALGQDISPNRRVAGEIVFEPVMNGIRVTARDKKHRMLWGFIGSKGMISQIHCPVAVYDTLQNLLSEELEKHGLPTPEKGDAVEAAQKAIADLEKTLKNLKSSIEVKKVSGATNERARAIARIARDADRMICLDTSYFKGTRGKNDNDS